METRLSIRSMAKVPSRPGMLWAFSCLVGWLAAPLGWRGAWCRTGVPVFTLEPHPPSNFGGQARQIIYGLSSSVSIAVELQQTG